MNPRQKNKQYEIHWDDVIDHQCPVSLGVSFQLPAGPETSWDIMTSPTKGQNVGEGFPNAL